MYAKSHEIAGAQLAVDAKVEQRKLSQPFLHLQANTDSPELDQATSRSTGLSVPPLRHAKSLRARSTSAPIATGAARLGVCRPSQPQCAGSTSGIDQIS